MAIARLWLFLYILIFYSLVFVVRSYLLWRATGINPITFQNKDDAHDWNGKLFTFVSLTVILVTAVYTFGEEWYQYLIPIPYLDNPTLHYIGWVLMLLALPFIFIAQLQMANSWRIGIDEREKTALVTHGIFAYSRNPIFLGILVSYLGFFLLLPNALTFLLGGLSYTSVQIQVRLEEAFLKRQHGSAFEDYCKRVKRWCGYSSKAG